MKYTLYTHKARGCWPTILGLIILAAALWFGVYYATGPVS